MKTGWTQNHRPRCKTDATWLKVHNSFSMKFGWRILMKSSQFIFNEIWMTNIDEKSTIHFQWNVDGKSWWKFRNSFSMKCGWKILMKSPEFIFNAMWMTNLGPMALSTKASWSLFILRTALEWWMGNRWNSKSNSMKNKWNNPTQWIMDGKGLDQWWCHWPKLLPSWFTNPIKQLWKSKRKTRWIHNWPKSWMDEWKVHNGTQ